MLEAGATLGPYQIIEPLGAGGMGEVYKARDTRLHRVVALKILSSHLSDNAGGRERFEREARAIAGLNHPHICTLYDVGRQGETDFLVMEHLEGETLAARLAAGALPLDQALTYAIQIADALDCAHRLGIVHRDLKPANVMLTRSGAKLLDFGLAKLRTGPQAAGVASTLPTAPLSTDLTAQGTIVGTLQYMAPEQLEGLDADARTDIFAFGAVLYEMITGRKAFAGKSQASLISAIMSANVPSVSDVQPLSPPALDHLIKTCLRKDPSDRWQTAHDVGTQLRWIAAAGTQAGMPAPLAARRRARGRMAIALLAAAVVAIAAMAVPTVLYFRPTPHPGEIRFTVDTPLAPNPTFVAVSPDGRTVVFQASAASASGITTALYLRRLDSMQIERLAGTEDAAYPFWSPDGRYVAFVSRSTLKKVPVAGGAAESLASPATAGVGSWSSHDRIVFQEQGGLFSVSASGGEAKRIDLDTGPAAAFPCFLPDGNHFLYTASGSRPGVYVGALDSSETRFVMSAPSAIYAGPGFLFFQREGRAYAQAFDAKAFELSGESMPVAEVYINPFGRPALAASDNGVVVYRSAQDVSAAQQFVWYSRDGGRTEPAGSPGPYNTNFDLSPDGSQVAVSTADSAGGTPKLWVLDWARDVTTPLTFEPTGTDVVWSPDGQKVAYTTAASSNPTGVAEKNSSGLGEPTLLVAESAPAYVEDWSKDGTYLAYGTGGDIWAVPLSGDRKPFPVVQGPFTKDEPHFSFDTKWLAYASTESGRWQVYVTSFPEHDQKRQVSTAGGSQPRWNRTGTELYYMDLDGKIMAVDVSLGARLDSGTPRVLFETGLQVLPTRDQYAVTRDGQRFLVLKPLTGNQQGPLSVIVNWSGMNSGERRPVSGER